MKQLRIALVKGDGIGPEVVNETVRVLKAVMGDSALLLEEFPFSAEYYLKTGKLVTDEDIETLKRFDSILLGAVGDPRIEPGLLEFGIVGKIRFSLDLYVNLRPINLLADYLCPIKNKSTKDIDMMVVRENTEDCYRGKTIRDGSKVMQEMIYTEDGTRRIIKYAFEMASKRRKFLTLVDKANAIRAHLMYRSIFAELAKNYPDVKTDAVYVDAFCMWMIKNPEKFDTVVTTNMFGDIVTDLGAVLQGGMGIAAGANIHPGQVSCFEPIHGSAPKYAGQNRACPFACILAGALMLDFLGQKEQAKNIEKSVQFLLSSKQLPLSSDSPYGTTQQTDMLLDILGKVT